MLVIKVLWCYLLGAWASVFDSNSSYALAFCSLFKVSYKLPARAQTDRLIGYKIVYSSLKSLISNKIEMQDWGLGNRAILYDGNSASFDTRRSYLKYYNPKVPPLIGFYRSNIIGYKTVYDLCMLAIITLLLGFITSLIVLLLGPKRYIAISFLPLNFLESFGLFAHAKAKDQPIRELYYFNVYEQNANMDALLAMRLGFDMIKIPSEVPLSLANSILIADKLAICFPYQHEEINYFSSIRVNQRINFGPENIIDSNLFASSSTDGIISELAFYSSGMWLRNQLGHLDLGINQYESEELLLRCLLAIARSNKLSLRIFLHPMEKSETNKLLTIDYYNSFKTPGDTFELVNWNISSNQLFRESELVVALYSSILFQRIYCGFPTLIVPLGLNVEFPISTSDLKNITVLSLECLEEKVDESLHLNYREFMNKNKMFKYSRKSKIDPNPLDGTIVIN